MPNRPSAKKHLKQTKKRTKRNKSRKKDYKEAKKAVLTAIENQESEDKLKEKMSVAKKKIAKASKTGAIKQNKASRLTSQLQQKVNEYLDS